ncbi:helix-turn-helix domain-containing protein [Actinophytocola sp. NPDC049390]|uniref:nSTAND1 domain-containing NTPase n=1 Tax=Actinophytocola sp. NPDC049390 TaxID=3363894 RepID=UPI0037AB5DC8
MADTTFEHGPKTTLADVRSRQDFARALTTVRELAGLTVRDVAKSAGIPDSTAGGYFSGRHLPPVKPVSLLTDILRACGVNDDEELHEWRRVLNQVRRAPGRRPSDAPVPYRGLESFEPEHAQWFHGRESLIQVLLDRVVGQWPDGDPVVVVGPSGSGKSSLLRAGLIPALCGRESPVPDVHVWRPVLFTPGAHPRTELARRLAAAPDDSGLLVVVDQLEELFILCPDPRARRAFLAELTALRQGPRAVLLVLGLRADFYPQAARSPELLGALQHAQVVVGPMTAAELRSTIIEPARSARLDIDDGLVELLLHELDPGADGSPGSAHEPGALPLLSHALHATWLRARRGTMTIADYSATGGITEAIACTADAVFDRLTEAQQRVARRLLLRLVHLGDRVADARRRVSYAEILTEGDNDEGAAVGEVLDTFVEQRLLTADTETVNITHEALLTAWPRLRGWIDADRAGLRVHGRLAHDAKVWQDTDRDPGALYRGGKLATAQEWAAGSGHDGDLNALEREFLAASVREQESEQRQQRRRTAVLRRLVAALAVLVLIAGGLTAYVFQQRTIAIAERDMAISRQVAGEANRLRGHDASLAKQLAVAAYAISPTPEARASLLDATAAPTATRVLGPEGAMQAVAITPDGRLMAAAGSDRTVRLWRLHQRSRAAPLGNPLTGATDTIFAVAFNPAADVLAAAGGDRVVRLWDVTDPAKPTSLGHLTGAGNTVYSIAFSPDGHTLAAASADNAVHLWHVADVGTPVAAGTLRGFDDYVQAVAFSPDGRTLAAGGADGTVRLWDLARRPRPLATLTGPGGKVFTVAFSPDSRTVAAGSADKNVYLWDFTRRDAPDRAGAPLTGATSWINAITFSPDGRTLAAGGSDATVRLWDLATRTTSHTLPHPTPVTAVAYAENGATLATGASDGVARLWTVPGPTMTESSDTVFSALFGPDGTVLFTGSGSADGQIRSWDITDRERPRRLGQPVHNPKPANRSVGAVALSPDGRLLAAGGLDGGTQLWDVRDPARPVPVGAPLTGLTTQSEFVIFSPDGRTLAAGGDENTVWLWDVTDPARPGQAIPLIGATNYVYSIAFSPDGRTLAAGSVDTTVRLWDIADPTSPEALATLTGPSNYVYSVAFSPDGGTLAAGSSDKTVRFWDVTNRRRPTPVGPILTGPSNYVFSVAFHPDGGLLAASTADRTIWLWDVADVREPRHLATLTAPTGGVNSVAFSPDGHVLAGSGNDRITRLWLVDPQRAIDHVCATAGDPITSAEWDQYVQGLPYRSVCP